MRRERVLLAMTEFLTRPAVYFLIRCVVLLVDALVTFPHIADEPALAGALASETPRRINARKL